MRMASVTWASDASDARLLTTPWAWMNRWLVIATSSAVNRRIVRATVAMPNTTRPRVT